jgi:hypothetical protein
MIVLPGTEDVYQLYILTNYRLIDIILISNHVQS